MIQEIVYNNNFYISVLVLSIVGMLLADWKYQLAFWFDWKSSIKSIGAVMALLLIFDIIGVFQNIFTTNQKYVIGIYFGTPNLPIEELFFLFMLCYVTLLVFRVLLKRSHV